MKRNDSTTYFLDLIKAKTNYSNSIDIGINESYRAELLMSQEDFSSALMHLQKAIIIFSGSFKGADIHSNPSNFTGTFAYYRLFDALYKKAEAFSALYAKRGDEKDLIASFAT